MKKQKHIYEPLPRSKEEALANPIRVVGLAVKETMYNLKMGYLEPFRWYLNRPMSLKFDLGIELKEPIECGELICNAD